MSPSVNQKSRTRQDKPKKRRGGTKYTWRKRRSQAKTVPKTQPSTSDKGHSVSQPDFAINRQDAAPGSSGTLVTSAERPQSEETSALEIDSLRRRSTRTKRQVPQAKSEPRHGAALGSSLARSMETPDSSSPISSPVPQGRKLGPEGTILCDRQGYPIFESEREEQEIEETGSCYVVVIEIPRGVKLPDITLQEILDTKSQSVIHTGWYHNQKRS